MSEVKVQALDGEDGGLFLTLLLRWARRWKAIVAFVMVFTILTGALAYNSKKTYKANANVLIKGQKSSATSLLSSLGAGDMASLIGSNNTDLYSVMSLTQSRNLAEQMIRLYRLDTVWEFKSDWKFEEGYKAWGRQFKLNGDELNPDVLDFSFSDHDPERAAKVVNSVLHWVDSAYAAMGMSQARRNYEFVSGRVLEKRRQLDSADAALLSFMKRERLVAPDERLVLTARKIAELEAERETLDIEGRTLAQTHGTKSSARGVIEEQKRMIEEMIRKLDNNGPSSWTTAPVGKDVERRFVYERKIKDVERHAAVLKYLIQQQEMLQIDARKDVPVIVMIDSVRVPQKKSAPKVALLMELVFSVCTAFALLVVAIEDDLKRILRLVFREAFGRR